MRGGNLKRSRVYQRGCNMNFELERSIDGDEICLVGEVLATRFIARSNVCDYVESFIKCD
jgi:hypothetical protein